jgi:soluble lytic murein transglycosylase
MFGKCLPLALLLAVASAQPTMAKVKLPSFKATKAAPARPHSLADQAIQAADNNRWSDAESLAARTGDKLVEKLVAWMDLSRPGTDASFERISAFIKANPDWPAMGSLRKRAEEAIPQNLEPAEIVRWFDAYPPVTPDGVTLYADSLDRLSKFEAAAKLVRDFWVNGTFTAPQQSDFEAHFRQRLTKKDMDERADRLIWDGLYEDARRMLPLLDRDAQAVAHARIVLAIEGTGEEAALAEVPGDDRRDPGLLYARIKAAREDMRDETAIALLEKAPATSSHGEKWWNERNILAHRALERHEYDVAYKLALENHQTEPAQIADAEWLAGWIALRFLDDPGKAAQHFAFMYEHVLTPLSKARAAYWEAEALAKQGEAPEAETWYGHAAKYPTTFYGQLATEALHKPLVLPGEPRPTPAEESAFEHSDLVRAAHLLHSATGSNGRADAFITRLGEISKTPVEQALTVRLARELNVVPLSVQIAKRAIQNNIATLVSGYPLLTGIKVNEPEPALVHGIIRQESLFNASAYSPAGAIGLMQLMPATANSEAKKLGVKNTNAQLSSDPAHNVLLGSHYLDDMITNYRGSYVLAIASYNAGPGHVNGWLRDYGDPRGDIDPIDWIEMIPVTETRNYVQRVLENTQVYRARLAGNMPVPVRLAEDLRR